MPRSDAILSKAHILTIQTMDGAIDTYDVVISFDHEARKEPTKAHFMGRQNESSNPNTSTSYTGTITMVERDAEFEDFLHKYVWGQELGAPYPDMSLSETANYENGLVSKTKWNGVQVTGRSKSGSGDDFKNMAYTVEFDPDRIERG